MKVAIAALLLSIAHASLFADAIPSYGRPSKSVYGHGRSLSVSIEPWTQKSVPFDNNLEPGSPDIAVNDFRVAKLAPGCAVPEQVHLTYWSSTSVLVSWATCDAQMSQRVPSPQTTSSADSSTVRYGTTSGRLDKTATGVSTSYVYNYAALNQPSFASPVLHHVLLKDLQPGVQYFYSPATKTSKGAMAKEYNFTLPKPSFPLKIGVMADPGQTYNTSVMLDHLQATNPELVMLIGDFTYADEWVTAETRLPDGMKYTFQPKWDTFGRLVEPLLAHVPLIHTDGNHEIEQQPNGVRNTAYNYRYPVPQHSNEAPKVFKGTSTSQPYSNLYYAVELPGVFKSISLTSYSIDQVKNGFRDDQEQFKWLEKELEKTDRSVTPWLIVMIHAPWYTSYSAHYKENECMRQSYEWLLTKYNVDIMLFGHVHAYERTKPIKNFKVDECGPVHFNIGDGGNVEGLYKEFIDTIKPRPKFCDNPKKGLQFPSYQPQQCLTDGFDEGPYCYTQQPTWSAFREPSFGHGTLELLNATHATWTWTKNQWPVFNVADQVTVIRKDKAVGSC